MSASERSTTSYLIDLTLLSGHAFLFPLLQGLLLFLGVFVAHVGELVGFFIDHIFVVVPFTIETLQREGSSSFVRLRTPNAYLLLVFPITLIVLIVIFMLRFAKAGCG